MPSCRWEIAITNLDGSYDSANLVATIQTVGPADLRRRQVQGCQVPPRGLPSLLAFLGPRLPPFC